MREVYGEFWNYPADYHVLTTNPIINMHGEVVMGRGVALQAKQRFPQIPTILAEKIRAGGNHVHYIGRFGTFKLISFPVKHHWRNEADVELIARSCAEIMLCKKLDATIVIPRPGCGNGRLNWNNDVRPVVSKLLDDRFHIITWRE